MTGLMTCSVCGHHPVAATAPACPKCGAPTGVPVASPRGDGGAGSVLAGLASFFIPGLGQLVQGRGGAALVHFVLALILWPVLLGWIVHLASAVGAASWKGD